LIPQISFSPFPPKGTVFFQRRALILCPFSLSVLNAVVHTFTYRHPSPFYDPPPQFFSSSFPFPPGVCFVPNFSRRTAPDRTYARLLRSCPSPAPPPSNGVPNWTPGPKLSPRGRRVFVFPPPYYPFPGTSRHPSWLSVFNPAPQRIFSQLSGCRSLDTHPRHPPKIDALFAHPKPLRVTRGRPSGFFLFCSGAFDRPLRLFSVLTINVWGAHKGDYFIFRGWLYFYSAYVSPSHLKSVMPFPNRPFRCVSPTRSF